MFRQVAGSNSPDVLASEPPGACAACPDECGIRTKGARLTCTDRLSSQLVSCWFPGRHLGRRSTAVGSPMRAPDAGSGAQLRNPTAQSRGPAIAKTEWRRNQASCNGPEMESRLTTGNSSGDPAR